VKKPSLLVPVQRVVGGVEIDNDLGWRCGRRVAKEFDKGRFDRLRVMSDLVVGGG
jgi:hypothetical protein